MASEVDAEATALLEHYEAALDDVRAEFARVVRLEFNGFLADTLQTAAGTHRGSAGQ
ncbi:hypothetical protein LXT13_26435 [Pelomonas sp. P8]|uniref:Uncharacterized protein n=2 Tax=Pelomonas cellulosilytica TaxID=2906762 RepID=A0ABS8Y145_9BURK|nr:hypothetical protein [Pelomonas sp. P8]